MEQVDRSPDIESRRMELRGVVRLAGEVVAQYWPMRTFVHHNPLHSLEYLPFEETVRRGKQFMGGNGYLPGQLYRGYLKAGRIQSAHLEAALKPLVQEKQVVIGARRVAHGEVLRACLAEGLSTPVMEPLDDQLPDPAYELIDRVAARLEPVLTFPDLRERIRTIAEGDQAALGRWLTLSHWCDDTLGTQIVRQINDQLIKWCEAFLDEGHATWGMPEREKGLYVAWKALAAQEWSLCGIEGNRRKIASAPEYPEDTLLDSLDALGFPDDLRLDYLSLQLTALPGWAGFIKWRGDERDYPWQQTHPAGLVRFLAIRLWYARELVQKACRQELGIEGRYDAVTAYMRGHSESTICGGNESQADCPPSMPRKSIGWRIRNARAGRPCLIAIAWKWSRPKRQPHAEAQPRNCSRWYDRWRSIRHNSPTVLPRTSNRSSSGSTPFPNRTMDRCGSRPSRPDTTIACE
jgi:uncharacterized protein YbcC (UPF0753/DUF2309 family)